MRPRSRHLPVLTAVAVAAGLLAAAPAGAAPTQRCNELRGTVKLRTASIKVVERKVNDRRLKGRRLLGCSLPRGKVFTVAERGTPKRRAGDPNSVSYDLGENAGDLLRVRRSFGDGVAQIQFFRETVMDLSDGSNRTFYQGVYGENVCQGEEGASSGDTPPPERVVLHEEGGFAVLYANPRPEAENCYPNDGKALLVGFGPSGARVTLDLAPIADISADSVQVSGDTFSWTNAGQARSEEL